MKNNYCYYIVLFASVLSILSCETHKEENEIGFSKLYSRSFKIDSLTKNFINYSKIIGIGQKSYYTFLNNGNNNIYLYPIERAQADSTIEISIDGPIGHRVSGYQMISDTLITVSNFDKTIIISKAGKHRV